MLKPCWNEDLLTIQELRTALIGVNRYVTPTRELAGRLNTLQSPPLIKVPGGTSTTYRTIRCTSPERTTWDRE